MDIDWTVLEQKWTSSAEKNRNEIQACAYAALMLYDGELEISEEKLRKVLQASGNEVNDPIMPAIFAKALKGQNIGAML